MPATSEDVEPEMHRQPAEEEAARWFDRALPHAVTLAAALTGAGVDRRAAASEAVKLYCEIERRLENSARK